MGKAISITLEEDALKNEKLITLAVKVPETTKKQYDTLKKYYKTNGRDLLSNLISQVYMQIFEEEK